MIFPQKKIYSWAKIPRGVGFIFSIRGTHRTSTPNTHFAADFVRRNPRCRAPTPSPREHQHGTRVGLVHLTRTYRVMLQLLSSNSEQLVDDRWLSVFVGSRGMNSKGAWMARGGPLWSNSRPICGHGGITIGYRLGT